MPRLIPRLLESLKATANTPAGKQVRPIYPASRGRVSLRQPVPPSPDFSSSRTRSILLDQQNPVLHPKDFVQHKSLPPRVRLHRNHRKRVVERDGTVGVDVPREMLAIERQWWANPYRESSCTSTHLSILTGYASQNALHPPTTMHYDHAAPTNRSVFIRSCTLFSQPFPQISSSAYRPDE